jgi:hypothetical protein
MHASLFVFSGLVGTIHYVSGICATLGDGRRAKEQRNTFERISMLLSVMPVVTITTFAVFVLGGGGSTVAQLTSNLTLWGMWCDVWGPSFFLNPVIGITQACAFFMRRPRHHEVSVHICLGTGALVAAIAWLIVIAHAPDA